MPDTGGAGQPQRFCTNCGAELRAGTGFCVSCGASVGGTPLGQGPEHPGGEYSEPRSSSATESLADSLRGKLEGLRRWSSGSSSSLGTRDIRHIRNRMVNWFIGLPSVPKLILVGLVLVALLVVLSPVVRVVAIIAFLISVVVLATLGIQRKPVRGWVVAAICSLVLIPVSSGVSGALYGTGFEGGSGLNANGGVAGEVASDSDGQFSDLDAVSEAERDYVTTVVSMTDETIGLVNRQADLSEFCGGPCYGSVTAMEEIEENQARYDEVSDDAYALEAPNGYEESHGAFRNFMITSGRLMGYFSMGVQNGDPAVNGLRLDAANYIEEMSDSLPPEGKRIARESMTRDWE